MYKSFTIRNFRGFKNLTIKPLGKINLIAGKNNVGKTALLEALWLRHGFYNPELAVRINLFRGLTKIKTDEFLWNIFTDFEPKKTIDLISEDMTGEKGSLQISVREKTSSRSQITNGNSNKGIESILNSTSVLRLESTDSSELELLLNYSGPQNLNVLASAYVESGEINYERPSGIKQPLGIFLAANSRISSDTLAERFGDLAINKQEGKVVQALQVIEPRLNSLTVQHQGGVPIIFGDIGEKRLMPIPLLGEGIGHLLGIILAIPAAKDGIILVDEVENGFHYSVMEKVWEIIGQFADEYNVQLFATTHSEENIRAAHRAFYNNNSDDFIFHRLERVNNQIQVVTIEEDLLQTVIEMDAEIR